MYIKKNIFTRYRQKFKVMSHVSACVTIVLLEEETREPGENHRAVANHRQTLSHNVVSSRRRHKRGSNSQL
jgi:hypothetical protein